MDNEIRTEDEISLADLFACLLAKIQLLIVLLLTGCLLGGVFGYLKSYNVVYYGTEMTFFVSPEKPGVDKDGEYVIYGTYGNTVMDTMIRFLSTEKAAEEYVKDMEFEGLPQKPDPEAEIEVYSQQVKDYDEFIRKVQDSITFRYYQDEEKKEGTDYESKNYIYVKLSVQEEGIYTKEFTRELLRQMQVKIPKVVEETMLNPDENTYEKTGCTLVTPLYPMVEWMNESYTLTETIKYAALLGLATLLVACMVVVIIDRLDKRVKEIEQIEKKFDVPVLGVIPTILSLSSESENKGGNK